MFQLEYLCYLYARKILLRTYSMLATVFSDDSQSSLWWSITESLGAHGECAGETAGAT